MKKYLCISFIAILSNGLSYRAAVDGAVDGAAFSFHFNTNKVTN